MTIEAAGSPIDLKSRLRCFLDLIMVVVLVVASTFLPINNFPKAQASLTLYVGPTACSDSGAGSQSQPFCTLQKAATTVSAGDTVIVEDGTYTGANGCSGNMAIVCLSRGGAANQLVTFKARNLGKAKLDGQGTSNEGYYFLSTANFVRIEGFEITGVNAITPAGGSSAIALYNGGHDSQIVNNNIHGIGAICTDTANGQNGVFLQQPNVLIAGNIFHDNGRFASGQNGCAPTTTNYQNHDHGIYLNGTNQSAAIPGANTATIVNNIFANHQRGWAIQMYPGSLSNVTIANNSFAFANPYRDGHIIVDANLTNVTIANNIFYQPTNVGVRIPNTPGFTNVTISNNLTSVGSLVTKNLSGLTQTNNLTSKDPLFVSPASRDFHLQSTSPAIDVGTTIAAASLDADSTVRPQGSAFDLGAYEYGGGLTASPTPTPTVTPSPTPSPSPTVTPSVLPTGQVAIQLLKTVDKTTATTGDTLTYTLTYTNLGTAAGTNFTVTDVVPTGTTYVTGSATGVGATYVGASNSVTWLIGMVAAGASSSLSFEVTVN